MSFEFGTWQSQPQVYVLLGYPLEKTLSPAMHNSAFKKLGIEAVYLPLRVSPNDIEAAVKAMRRFNWAGANVTIPHKQSIMEHLDAVDQSAKVIGAVNTIVVRDNKLHGYNTDAPGFSFSFPAQPEQGTITILGAGGAARAVVYALLNRGFGKIVLMNRTIARAETLAADLDKHFPHSDIVVADYSDRNWRLLQKASCIINCTPLDFPFPGQWLDKPIFDNCYCAYDLRYQPEHNNFLALAAANGVEQVIDGSEMLLGQAVLAFKLWFNIDPPIDIMRTVLL